MRGATKNNAKGSIALVLVLITVTLITALVVEITYRSQVSASVVVNRRESAKAYELARAAINWSVFRLQLDSALDQIPVIPGTNYGGKKDDLLEVQWAIPIPYPFAPGKTTKADAASPSDLGGSFVSVLSDESARINLNDVGSGGPQGNVKWSGTAEILENLLLSPRFKAYFKGRDHREVLWGIDDWTDADSIVNHIGGGIEDAEYQIEGMKYHVKNAPFYTLTELHYLKPMTDDLYRELAPFVTVYPFDARLPRYNISPVNPLGKINVNTASLELIASLFNRDTMPDWRERLDCAQKFVKARESMAFRSVRGEEPSFLTFLGRACRVETGQSGETPILTPSVERVLSPTCASDTFSVEANGLVGVTDKAIRAVLYRKDSSKIKILYWKVI
ncbi:MAG: hypothetical protein V1495_00575 [Pseudomonadota bacterium]